MNPEQQRIAIAEACGWKRVNSVRGSLLPMEFRVDSIGDVWTCLETQMPDYLNDLNAMHEAEQSIPEGLTAYWIELVNICGSLIPASVASAQQRAEAFLKTIGKWKGAQP